MQLKNRLGAFFSLSHFPSVLKRAGFCFLGRLSFFLFFLLSLLPKVASAEEMPRLLVLVIASENFPVYTELQKMWRSHMDFAPEQVEIYFIKGDPGLQSLAFIEGDTIWSRTKEGFPGETSAIIDKTIYSVEVLRDRLNDFDYVLRTNLSSFYVFSRLLNRLKTLPRTGCYFASGTDESNTVGSGCGFILSTDLVRLLIAHKDELVHRILPPDDCVIARFLAKYGISLLPHPRQDLLSKEEFLRLRYSFSDDLFHFRVKTEDHLRLEDDLFVHKGLFEMFYKE